MVFSKPWLCPALGGYIVGGLLRLCFVAIPFQSVDSLCYRKISAGHMRA